MVPSEHPPRKNGRGSHMECGESDAGELASRNESRDRADGKHSTCPGQDPIGAATLNVSPRNTLEYGPHVQKRIEMAAQSARKRVQNTKFSYIHQHFTRSSARKKSLLALTTLRRGSSGNRSPTITTEYTSQSQILDFDLGQERKFPVRIGGDFHSFVEDKACVNSDDFGDRIHAILENMCDCNERSGDLEQNPSAHLFKSQEEHLPLFSLIHQLVKWPGTSRTVLVFALVLMDRMQQTRRGVTVRFSNVAKVFTCSVLIAKKNLEDSPVWNSDVLGFPVFEDVDEVNKLEKVCLDILNWRTHVTEFDFRTYDHAVLLPLLQTNAQYEFRPYKKRKSITATILGK